MTLPLWKALLLGLIQGATEFLPISSSGHLVLAERLLGVNLPGLSFEVTVHAGTLLAVLAAYRRDLDALLRGSLELLRGLPGLLRSRPAPGRGPRALSPEARLVGLLLVGSVPAGLAGVLGKPVVKAAFDSLRAVGVGWLLTAALLAVAARALRRAAAGAAAHGSTGRRRVDGGDADLTVGQALWIGLFQAVAIMPGVSRSGSTIAAGLLAGLGPDAAARFSFLLSIPAIAGAGILDVLDVLQSGSMPAAAPLAVGFAAAAGSGYVAIHWLLGLLRRGRLGGFAVYCLALGLLVLTAFR